MIFLRSSFNVIVFILFSVACLPAQAQQQSPQQDISEGELKKFASAFQQVQVVTQDAQQEMVSAVEEKGLDVQRFNELQQAATAPEAKVEANEGDLKKFDAATQEIQKIQVQAQEEMQKAITEKGLTIERYQEIMGIVQNDMEIQKKLEKYLQG